VKAEVYFALAKYRAGAGDLFC